MSTTPIDPTSSSGDRPQQEAKPRAAKTGAPLSHIQICLEEIDAAATELQRPGTTVEDCRAAGRTISCNTDICLHLIKRLTQNAPLERCSTSGVIDTSDVMKFGEFGRRPFPRIFRRPPRV